MQYNPQNPANESNRCLSIIGNDNEHDIKTMIKIITIACRELIGCRVGNMISIKRSIAIAARVNAEKHKLTP